MCGRRRGWRGPRPARWWGGAGAAEGAAGEAAMDSVVLKAAPPLGGAPAQGARPNPTPLPLDPPKERILSPGSSYVFRVLVSHPQVIMT